MKNGHEVSDGTAGTGTAYAALQLSKALTTATNSTDPDAHARAQQRVERWLSVMGHAMAGTAHYGSRTPFDALPAWVTLEVATGGFATGRLSAGGELTAEELELAASVTDAKPGHERAALNLWHLTDAGVHDLQQRLLSGEYRIDHPEEAALPTVAWLIGQGRVAEAQELIDTIAPYFDRLRFFPPRAPGAPAASAEVFVFTAGEVMRRLAALPASTKLAEQKHVVEVRLPLYDEAIALFLETYSEGWPNQHYPPGWPERARAVCVRFEAAGAMDTRTRKVAKDRVGELFGLLALSATAPAELTGRQVGRIRRIVDDVVHKRGRPDSARLQEHRQRQLRDVAAPTYPRIGKAVANRLSAFDPAQGISEPQSLCLPLSAEEAEAFGLEPGTALPPAIQRRLALCRRGSLDTLIGCGLITSADTIARLLPSLTAEIRSAHFADPALRGLYAATYRAFRRRRSLLLLDLQKQVGMKELPWVAAIEGDRAADAGTAESARLALVETAAAAITAFPYAILPNKLLQEFRALANAANLELPFVDEIAADIYMGELSNKFLDAARRAARTLGGTLYARYYDIDLDALAGLSDRPSSSRTTWWSRGQPSGDGLSMLAVERAALAPGRHGTASNGTILEQVQILTTHNLALLFNELDLKKVLPISPMDLALRGFEWICNRQQIQLEDWHARLIMLKKTAYAWRQMIFFLSMLDTTQFKLALGQMQAHLAKQPAPFQARFRPAMLGLQLAARGERLNQHAAGGDGARVFLGWTTERHWLLSPNPNPPG